MTELFSDDELRFAWWNVQDFAHFDPERVIDRGWPKSQGEYEAKCQLIDDSFDEIFSDGIPHLIGLGETTLVAAEELRRRKFPGYLLHHDGSKRRSDFQIAVLFRKGVGLDALAPVIGDDMPRNSRWMPVVQVRSIVGQFRFIFCHWTSFGDNAGEYRGRLADQGQRALLGTSDNLGGLAPGAASP